MLKRVESVLHCTQNEKKTFTKMGFTAHPPQEKSHVERANVQDAASENELRCCQESQLKLAELRAVSSFFFSEIARKAELVC
jgi:hypothetical protein